MAGGLAALALLTVVGMAALRPGDTSSVDGGTIVISSGIVAAEVTAVTAMNCPVETRPGCARVEDIGFSDAINREIVATEVVATLVGSIGLVAAVPLTTATAALLAMRLPVALLPEHDHAHHH